MKRTHGQSGLTYIEIAIALSLATGVAMAGTMLSRVGMKDASAAFSRTMLSSRAAAACDRFARELQGASLLGEDENGNGREDPGEDVNRNGRLDSDWNLAPGATTSDLSFNVPRPDAIWSGQVRYWLDGDVLARSDGGIVEVMCRNVTAFTVTRTGTTLDVSLTVSRRDSFGEEWTATEARRAHVRN